MATDPLDDAETDRLATLARYGLIGGPTLAALDDFAAIAASVFGTPMAAVTVLAETELWLLGRSGVEAETLPRQDAFCTRAVESAATVIIPDLALDPRFADNPLVVNPPFSRFYAGAPLRAPGGQILGTMCVFDSKPRTFDAADQLVLERLARRVVDTMELRARTLQLEQEQQLLASTGEVLALIAAGAELREVLTSVALAMERREPDVLCSILLLDGTTLHDGAGPSISPEYRRAIDGVTIGPGVGCCGDAAYTKCAAVAVDIQEDPNWVGYRELAAAADLRACWSTPILDGGGAVLGTFALYFRAPWAPRAEHWALAKQWSDLAGLAIMRTRELETMRAAAVTDGLTGLPNRAALLDACTAAVRHASPTAPVALLFIDLDRFKMLNDSLGHAVGDDFLRAFAARLSAAAGPEFPVFRFGGDEFVVLAAGELTEEQIRDLGQRLVRTARVSIRLERRQVALSLSVGIALTTSPDQTASSLLRNADAAVYRAKDLGRDRVELFDAALHHAAIHRLELEEAIRKGLDLDQFSLAFQPKVDLLSGRVTGVEALLRWAHPTRGNVPPAEFIPVAEDCGLILPLGTWVLETAIGAHAARRLTDCSWRDVTVWVNVAPTQLTDELPGLVRQALDAVGLPAGLLGLEVTEGSLMADLPAARAVLLDLRAMGVQIALDDFGTGYSSLGQLKDLPVQVLKIDKSFIDGLCGDASDEGIVIAVLALARAHGLTVVAEGVETLAQLERLTALDCDMAQGYYFARPGALADIPAEFEVSSRLDRRLHAMRRTGTRN